MAQQILNPNSLAPNDKLGDTPNAYTAKINDNFTQLFAVATLTRRIVVNTIADLPTAVAGVITLAANTLYLQADDIDFSTTRLVFSANTVYSGLDSLVVSISYVGTLPFFSFVNVSGSIKNIRVVNPNSPLFSFSDSGSNVLRVVDVSYSSSSIGTIGGTDSGVRLTNFSGSATSNGLAFSGNFRVFLFEPTLSTLSAGKFIDLGSATFDSISINETNLNYVSGVVFLSGAASSANINAGGLASVTMARLKGVGTPLENITSDDALFAFSQNNTIRNSSSDGLLSMQGNSTATAIASSGTPVLIAGAWVVGSLGQFSGTTSGRLTYLGLKPVRLPITCSVSVAPTVSTGIAIAAYIAINGTVVAASKREGTASAGLPDSITLPWQAIFNKDDYVEVFVENNTNVTDLLVSSAIIRANQ
jgi:hypothetical protein